LWMNSLSGKSLSYPHLESEVKMRNELQHNFPQSRHERGNLSRK
jgi:hypothetical protein